MKTIRDYLIFIFIILFLFCGIGEALILRLAERI